MKSSKVVASVRRPLVLAIIYEWSKLGTSLKMHIPFCTNSFLPTSIALAPNWIGSSKKQKICNNWHKSHQQIRCRQKCKDSNEWSFAVALSKKKNVTTFFCSGSNVWNWIWFDLSLFQNCWCHFVFHLTWSFVAQCNVSTYTFAWLGFIFWT